MVAVDWSAPAAATTTAIPTYLDQVNPSMDRASPMHDAAFSRMDKLGAKLVRYLHWSSSQAPFAELEEGKFNFTKMDEYVLDFLACKNAPGSVMNFDAGPVGRQPPPGSLGLRTGRLHPLSPAPHPHSRLLVRAQVRRLRGAAVGAPAAPGGGGWADRP